MRRHRTGPQALIPALLCLLLTACSITDTGPAPAGPPASGLVDLTSRTPPAAVHVYFYSTQGLERVSRLYRGTDASDEALRQLAAGPDAAERARGLISYAPSSAPAPIVTAHNPRTLEVFAPQGFESRSALNQLVCTAADAASAEDKNGTSRRALQVRVHRAWSGDTVTQACTL
jgi:hypothetical protein